MANSHRHRKSSLLRVCASKGHPRDVQWMRKGAEGLRPNDAKISDALAFEIRESAIEKITDHVARETRNNRLSTSVEMIGHPTERERDRDLEIETDGGHGIGLKVLVTKRVDNGWRVCIKSTLRTVIRHGDGNVNPETPVGELRVC